MLQAFSIQWILLSSVAELLFCWNHWLGKHDSHIWNLIPGCLMWIVWMERNRRSFEDSEKSLVELIGLCQRSLFYWSRCWGFTECSSIVQFFSSLILVSWLFSVAFCFVLFCFHSHEHIVCFFCDAVHLELMHTDVNHVILYRRIRDQKCAQELNSKPITKCPNRKRKGICFTSSV